MIGVVLILFQFPREFDEMAVTLIPEPGDELLEDIQTSTETPLSDQANQLTAQTPVIISANCQNRLIVFF